MIFLISILPFFGYLSQSTPITPNPFSEAISSFAIALLTFGTTWLLIQVRIMKKDTTQADEVKERMGAVEEKVSLALSGNINEALQALEKCHDQQEKLQERFDNALNIILRQQETITELSISQITIHNKVINLEQQLITQKLPFLGEDLEG